MGVLRWARRSAEARVQLRDVEPEPRPDPFPVLRSIAAEALILQDQAEEVLAAVGRHEHLGRVAPRGGPLVHRFFVLRDRLPAACGEPRLDQLRSTLDTLLHHHAMQVSTALEFLAAEWRSEVLLAQVGAISGLGPAAQVLEDVYAELQSRPELPAA